MIYDLFYNNEISIKLNYSKTTVLFSIIYYPFLYLLKWFEISN